MGVIVFDIRDAERRLKEAGMAENLAATQAELMAESFIHHADQLATREDLQSGLSALADNMELRFSHMEARIEARMETQMERRFAAVDSRFAKLEARMNTITWVLGVNTAAVLVPLLNTLVT